MSNKDHRKLSTSCGIPPRWKSQMVQSWFWDRSKVETGHFVKMGWVNKYVILLFQSQNPFLSFWNQHKTLPCMGYAKYELPRIGIRKQIRQVRVLYKLSQSWCKRSWKAEQSTARDIKSPITSKKLQLNFIALSLWKWFPPGLMQLHGLGLGGFRNVLKLSKQTRQMEPCW